MKRLSKKQQQEIEGGDWGFLCGAAIGVGIGAVLISGGSMVGPALIGAEWACAIDATFLNN